MQKNINETTLALAGMVQAITLIRELAATGKIDDEAFKTCIQSIFNTNPANTLSVYGDLSNLKIGLEKLIPVFSPKTDSARLTIRSMLSLMRLQRKISRSQKLINQLTQRIEQVKKQVAYFNITHPTVIANLADIYIHAITPFRYRFYILGNQKILSVNENMEKIRALLLAAIRSAVLWQQLGGSRLKLIFLHKKISRSATHFLKEITNH